MSQDPQEVFAIIAAWVAAMVIVSISALVLVGLSVACAKIMGVN